TLGFTRRTDAALSRTSAEWLLNGKALTQESLAGRALLGRGSGDPKTAALAKELRDVRQQLAAAALKPPPNEPADARRARIAELTDKEQTLTQQLGRLTGYAPAPAWVELAAVRKALPERTVLVDVARFRPFDFKEQRSQPDRYVAWVV